MRIAAVLSLVSLAVAAQSAPAARILTLPQAEQLALTNHPELQMAQLSAAAAAQDTRVAQSAYLPTVTGSLTGAGALSASRIGAGALNNPSVYNRYANGVSASQLITDFGRTGNLVASAKLRARAGDQGTVVTREQVLLAVDQAYYQVLRAQALLQVAKQTVAERQVVADQIAALAKSQIKSGLDLTFAQVNLNQARLDQVQAENTLAAGLAQLATALGESQPQTYVLEPQPVPAAPPDDMNPLVQQALALRPELQEMQLEAQSASKYAAAEGDLARPTLSAVGTAGTIPWRQDVLPERYGAIAANLNIPIFNGFEFSALHSAALLRAQAAAQQLREEQNEITRDVRVAWLAARTAYQRIALTQELLDQATESVQLAQARYQLGLSSIVELSQAQLNLTQAQTENTDAKFDFEVNAAELNYQIGILK